MATDECASGSCAVPLQSRDEKRKAFEHDKANISEICQGLRDDLFRIGLNYFVFTFELARVEVDLRDVWDELIHVAKITPSEDTAHDRLVTLILELRELGQLARKNEDTGVEEAAVMPNGQRLWIDLPYLAEELHASWTTESEGLTSVERQSLAVLTGKLCGAGVCAPEVAQSALWLLKEAFETERPLAASSIEGQASKKSKPSIAELLPACLEWLRYGKFKLARWSLENYCPPVHQCSGDSTSPGPLTAGACIRVEGFSLKRWLFWRQRLGGLYRSGCSQVAKLARACFEEMIDAGLSLSVDIPGEKRFLDKTFEAVDKELASRNFRGCVSAEEIEIDPTWADGD